MIKRLLQKFFKIQPEEEMVQYWKTKLSVEAKVTQDKTGSYVMYMDGEKYPFPGFPRGLVLYKSLSKLKHELKQICNRAWYALEDGKDDAEVIKTIKNELFTDIKALMDERRLLMLPPEHMAAMPRELWRALTVLEKRHNSPKIRTVKEVLCFIMQEDDAYRFRVSYILQFVKGFLWFKPKNVVKQFDLALGILEHAEIVGDMKERQRLLRRILMLCLKDETIKNLFIELCNEWDWKKMVLSKGDKYFFRGKWFKVDYPRNQY
jgi:hypothetical protein